MAATAASNHPSASTPASGAYNAEAKARFIQKAVRFGHFASLEHLPPAELAIFEQIRATIPHATQCEDFTMHVAALRIAELTYRLDRVRRLEYSLYTERMRAICAAESIPEPTSLAERGLLEARIVREDSLGPRTLSLLHSQERFLSRHLQLAAEDMAAIEADI
jgi:hypothetical protein